MSDVGIISEPMKKDRMALWSPSLNRLPVRWFKTSFTCKGARPQNCRQFQHWSDSHRINENIKITAQNYRRTLTKHRKVKQGHGWTKLERIEMDCIWVNLKNIGLPFFIFTACQFILISKCHLHMQLKNHSAQLLRGHNSVNERLLAFRAHDSQN